MFTNANLFSLILNTGLEPWFSIASIDFLRPLQGIWDSDDHSMALSTPRNRIAQILWRVYIYPILLQSLCDGSKPRPFVLLMYITLCSTGLVLVSLYIYNYIYISISKHARILFQMSQPRHPCPAAEECSKAEPPRKGRASGASKSLAGAGAAITGAAKAKPKACHWVYCWWLILVNG